MKTNRIKAITTLEGLLLVILSLCIYIYTKQLDSNFLEKESYKTAAQTAYANLNKVTKNTKNGFAGKFNTEKDIVFHIGKNAKASKYCNDAKNELCWSPVWLWSQNTKPGSKLKSNQYIVVDFISKNCSYSKNIPNTCAFVYIDTNGKKSPNEIGKDILLFYMTKNGFIPAGTLFDTIAKKDDCDITKNRYNWGCTAALLGLQ